MGLAVLFVFHYNLNTYYIEILGIKEGMYDIITVKIYRNRC